MIPFYHFMHRIQSKKQILELFQKRLDELPDGVLGEIGALAFTPEGNKLNDKITHIAHPDLILIVPAAWKYFRGITRCGFPHVTLAAEESTYQLYYKFSSGLVTEDETEAISIENSKLIPASGVYRNKAWQAYLSDRGKDELLGGNAGNRTTDRQIAERILANPSAQRVLYAFASNSIGKEHQNGDGNKMAFRIYSEDLIWDSIGTERSHHPNFARFELRHLNNNVFRFGEKGPETYYLSVHTHLDFDDKDWDRNPVLKAAEKKFGRVRFLTFFSPADWAANIASQGDNNLLNRLHFGKELNAVEIAGGVIAVGLSRKVLDMGILNVDAMIKDQKVVAELPGIADKAFEEMMGDKPDIGAAMAFLDIIDSFTKRELPDYVEQSGID